MASSSALSFFSYPQHNPRQANLGNTVLVNLGQLRGKIDLWCLGYLQDIAGDQVLVDLDCTQFPAFWISTQYVWYHHLIDFGNSDPYPLRPPPLPVQVAVRIEPDGPLVFRQALLLNRPSVGNLFMCCVHGKTSTTDKGDDHVQEFQVVHRWQVVRSLPVTEPSLFSRLRTTGRLAEIPILKQIVCSSNITADHRPFREHTLIHMLHLAVNRAGFRRSVQIGLNHRVFVDIGNNSIKFLLFDLHVWEVDGDEGGQLEWTALSGQKFAVEIEEYLGKHDKMAVSEIRMCESSFTGETLSRHTTHDAEPVLGRLPWHLLSEVLLYLDFQSQLKARRVCSVWNSLLRTPSPCVIINFSSISKGMYIIDARKGYYLGTLLDRAVSPKTKVLALENMDDFHNNRFRVEEAGPTMKIIQELLALKEANLLAIMLKNCKLPYETRLRWSAKDFMAHELHHISKLLPMCQRLLLSNFTTVDFPVCDCSTMYMWCKTPQNITVTISYLEFRRSAGERKSVMEFVQALEPHLPAVDEIRAHFKERHQHLVYTLPYPDGWQRFRQFLRRHTFTELSTLDSFWNSLDLRNFDQLPLTKMILLLLDICLDMAFEDDDLEDLMVYDI